MQTCSFEYERSAEASQLRLSGAETALFSNTESSRLEKTHVISYQCIIIIIHMTSFNDMVFDVDEEYVLQQMFRSEFNWRTGE